MGPRPTLTRLWHIHECSTSRSQEPLLAEVRTLLAKSAIEPVLRRESLGFYSHVFLVPKKNGQFRLVINLRPLNKVLHCPHFKMETVADICSAIQPGDWATSLDLTDAYFHIPVAHWFRKYLRFVVGGAVYQFRALPFGLSPAPLVCTRLLAPLASHLHSRGIRFHRYLDDLLIRAQSSEVCDQWSTLLLELLHRLGLGVNLAKSDLVPSQDFVYVGVRFRTGEGIHCPPPDRLETLSRVCNQLLAAGSDSARSWLSLLGVLSSMEKLVPLGNLHIRPVHLCLRRQLSIRVHSLTCQVSLTPRRERPPFDGWPLPMWRKGFP